MTIPAMAAIAMTLGLAVTAACAQQTDTPEPPPAEQSHPEEAAVVAAVEQLFEAMRTGDSDMAAAVFHPEARLGRATEEGVSFRPPDSFIEAIGRPRDEVWDEPIWDWTVHVDGRLAQMWTKYAFYRDDTFSHCGKEGFQLYKGESGWQITQLVDTSRSEDCWYPPER